MDICEAILLAARGVVSRAAQVLPCRIIRRQRTWHASGVSGSAAGALGRGMTHC